MIFNTTSQEIERRINKAEDLIDNGVQLSGALDAYERGFRVLILESGGRILCSSFPCTVVNRADYIWEAKGPWYCLAHGGTGKDENFPKNSIDAVS